MQRTLQRGLLLRITALAASAALLVVGCGDDDSSADEPPVTDAVEVTTEAPPTATDPATTEPTTTEQSTEPTEQSTEPTEPTGTTEPAAPSPDTSATFPITVEHALGSTEIPTMPERVVSASGTMTGHLLALDVPVVAAQVLPPQSPLSGESGFLKQWADLAVDRGVEPIAGPEVNIEAIAAARPDLIVGNSFGGDAVTEDVYAQLSQIAPTIVIDHSGLQWQELAVLLGDATGRTAEVAAAVDSFESLVETTGSAIDNSHDVVAAVITANGINVFTELSSHGKLLASLGLTVREVAGGSLDGETGATTRSDVVSVSPELLADEFGDATILFVFAEQDDIDQALDLYPTLAALPATDDGRLVPLGYESFRLDRFSATLVVERLASALAPA